MLKPYRNFYIYDNKIQTASSSSCMLQPPENHVYEVFKVIDGKPLFIEDHLLRLKKSTEGVNINFDVFSLTEQIQRLIQLNNNISGNIKIILWSQYADIHYAAFYDFHNYPSETEIKNGVDIGIMEKERQKPNIKVFDYSMRKEASQNMEQFQYYEVLLLNKSGFITEGSRSNIFFINKNTIYTPPAKLVLEGITRKIVIELIKSNNLSLEESLIKFEDISKFEAVFLTGTSRGVLPVKQIIPHEKLFNPKNKLIRDMQNTYDNHVKNYISSFKWKNLSE